MNSTESGPGSKRQLKRRPNNACDYCRAKKIRCGLAQEPLAFEEVLTDLNR